MEELLTQEGMRLQGELASGILWSKEDVYARVFGLKRLERVRGVGFEIIPSRRSATNLSQFTSTLSSSSRTIQRISEFETSLREELARGSKASRKTLPSRSKASRTTILSRSKAPTANGCSDDAHERNVCPTLPLYA